MNKQKLKEALKQSLDIKITENFYEHVIQIVWVEDGKSEIICETTLDKTKVRRQSSED